MAVPASREWTTSAGAITMVRRAHLFAHPGASSARRGSRPPMTPRRPTRRRASPSSSPRSGRSSSSTATSAIRSARASRRGTCCSTPGRRSGPAATAARPSCPATPTRASCSPPSPTPTPTSRCPPTRSGSPESVIADIKTWIRTGAADPREDEATGVPRPPVDIEAGRRFWAFRKPVAHEPPATKDPAWARRDLDHFILAKLEAAGLAPSAGRGAGDLAAAAPLRPRGAAPLARGGPIASSSASRPTASTRRWRRRSMPCSPRRISASAGGGTGSTWHASPNRAARKRTSRSRTPGDTAITSSTR